MRAGQKLAGFFPPIYFHQFSLTPKYCLQYCYCRSPPKSPPIRDDASPKSPPHTPTGTRRTPPSTLCAPDAPHLQPPSSSATPKPPQLVFITNDPPASKIETWKRSHGPKLEPDMLWNRPVFLPSWTKSLLIYGQTGQLWSNSATGSEYAATSWGVQ
uniref:Uncharacterized protein n=2 Tax=Helianthus annuus TaxID=4232 RepID=A0A251UKF7_HELAN